jgi:hypothetical protein
MINVSLTHRRKKSGEPSASFFAVEQKAQGNQQTGETKGDRAPWHGEPESGFAADYYLRLHHWLAANFERTGRLRRGKHLLRDGIFSVGSIFHRDREVAGRA